RLSEQASCAALIPAALGGQGTGIVDMAVLAEEFHAVDVNISLTLLGTDGTDLGEVGRALLGNLFADYGATFERRLGRAIAESPLAATCKSARVTPLQLAQTLHCMRTRVEVPHGLADRVRGPNAARRAFI
ncbi:MAG TPA: hypothetical protein VNP53_01570, partial [Methylomirabilota bacterium]|nr:hypothetical protein [Methylomirabilota bacterium]